MKKTNYTLILLLLIATIVSCNQKEDKPLDTEKDQKVRSDFKRHIISVERGIELKNEFEENRIKLTEPLLRRIYKDTTFEDTKFVWFSLENMKQYVKFIEEIQKENPKKDVSGIRMYFAAYPNNKSSKYPGQQTFFMVPTVNSGKLNSKYKALNHFPFYIKSKAPDQLNGEFVIIKDIMLGSDESINKRLGYFNKNHNLQKAGVGLNFNMFNPDTEISTLFNEGEMVPPPGD